MCMFVCEMSRRTYIAGFRIVSALDEIPPPPPPPITIRLSLFKAANLQSICFLIM